MYNFIEGLVGGDLELAQELIARVSSNETPDKNTKTYLNLQKDLIIPDLVTEADKTIATIRTAPIEKIPKLKDSLFRRVKMADELSIQWWKNAAKECPVAVAFVDEDDKFLFVNQEWSILTGYAPAQLVGVKTWKDITIQEDIGGDAAAVAEIKSGKAVEYYMEKKYIRADGSHISVGIYVHRQPPYGKHQGYIIFAKQVGSKEMAALQVSFENLKNNITVLEHISRGFERIDERVKAQYDKIDSLEEIVSAIVASHGNISDSHSNINIGGDVTGQDKTGRDKNSIMILALAVLCVVFLGAFLFERNLTLTPQKIEVHSSEIEE